MLIALDVDGVCLDFVGPLLDVAGNPFERDDIKTFKFFDMFQPWDRAKALAELDGEHFWLNEPVIEGATEGIHLLRDLGHQIVFVTSPWLSCKTWERIRMNVLSEHFGAPAKDVIITSRKELVSGPDVLVDDCTENLDACAAASDIRLYKVPASYNTDANYTAWSWNQDWLRSNFG